MAANLRYNDKSCIITVKLRLSIYCAKSSESEYLPSVESWISIPYL